MKRFTSKNQQIGQLGENICVVFLERSGYRILERNFSTRHGEIDIIAELNNQLFFIEVKSIKTYGDSVSRGTYNPGENMTPHKIKKCYVTIFEYLKQKDISLDKKFQLDLYLVYIDIANRNNKIESIQNILMN